MGYKMKHTGVPALLKELVGDQHNLPEKLKKAIEASPAQSKPNRGAHGGHTIKGAIEAEKAKQKQQPLQYAPGKGKRKGSYS